MKAERSRLSDLVWKLAAAVVAFGLWLSVVDEKQALVQLEIPVRFDALATRFALAGDRPSSIQVRVQVSDGMVKELQPPDVEVRIDLGGLQEGLHTISLPPGSPAIVPLKAGIKVVEVFPSALRVRIEAKATRDIPVQASLTGAALDGYELAEYRVVPDHVRIVGPKSAVDAVTRAATREVPLDGVRESFSRQVRIDLDNPDVQLVGEPKAQLTVKIRERTGQRIFERIPLTFTGSLESQTATEHVRVTLRGPQRKLDALSAADVVGVVRLEGFAPRANAQECRVEVELPPGNGDVEVATVTPEIVAVKIVDRRSN